MHPLWPGLRPRWLPPSSTGSSAAATAGYRNEWARSQPDRCQHESADRPRLEVGGFDAAVGRVGTRPGGCEETELAIRLTASRPGSAVFYVPSAVVDHHVGQERLKFRYFVRRCWHEGLSKAAVVRLAGASAGLERERRHVTVVIPAALLRELRSFATGDAGAFVRLTALLAGLGMTAAGYITGRARHQIRNPAAVKSGQ